MKLTKKIEKEIINLMEDFWNQYLTGKIEPWSKYLVDNYRNIGGTEEEIWNSKKELLDYTYGVIDQMKDKVQLRNKTIQIIPYEPYFMVHELLDMYVIVDGDWSFYGKFRLSSLIQKFGTDWKVLHQHGSYPDSKTQKGEAFAVDALKAENVKLQNAVQKRTAELEQKNRELEVETALERIRAQAVAMKESSDLLDIVVTMRNEFIKLGHEAHYFWHMMWLPETYEKAMTSGDGSKIGFVMKLPRHIHGDIPLLAKWEKSKKPTVVYAMNVDEALDYVNKMISLGDFQNIDPQAPTEEDVRHIGGLTFIMARTTHGEIGYSLPGIVKNPPKDDIDILVKFAGAFDLAHQRFLDLQKAEKQARETQIELSLERIRSRVTAMQESSELFNVVVAMRKEFISLGHEADYFWHMQWLEDNYEMSMTSEDGSRVGMIITVPKFVHDDIKTLAAWEKSKDPTFVLALNAGEAWDYIDKMNTYGQYKQADPHAPTKEDIQHIGGLTFIIARTTHGEIGFSLAGKVDNPPKASIETLLRFASVFDLAYKRFEDLQKAEAQTRETQIELALEKVRSRTMGMQRSDELRDTAMLLFQQVEELGINSFACGFNIWDEDKKFATAWMASKDRLQPPFKTNSAEDVYVLFHEAEKRGESLFILEQKGKELEKHYKYLVTIPEVKKLSETGLSFPTFQIIHCAYFSKGYLMFITLEPVPDAHDIFKRFAKVFEQTYTRFLDLQKSEAQAREAQIQLSLERVRAKSMAMQSSDEVHDVLSTLFQQFDVLGIKPVSVFLSLFDREKRTLTYRASGKSGKRISGQQTVSTDSLKVWSQLFDKWKNDNSDEVEVIFYSKEILPTLFDLFSETFASMPKKERMTIDDFPKGGYTMHGYTPFGYLGYNHKREATEEEKNILSRFATEFSRIYQRFLDIEKAEAQAREAQIEAALERVRSQSMGMQTSEDLSKVTTEMFNQLRVFNADLFATGIVFCDKYKGHIEQWHSIPKAGMMSPFIVPIDLDYIHQYRYDQWEKGTELFSIEIPSDFIEQHFNDIFKLPSAQKVLKDFEDRNTPMPSTPSWEIDYGASFKHGYLLVSSLQPFEEAEILPRFAKVFEQTYTRFLDLQKAEAQAREAQIEASLERVRARAMAMHQTDELTDVLCVLFDQFDILGINPVLTHLTLFDQENETFSLRITATAKKRIVREQFIDINAVEAWKNSFKNWKKSEPNAINCIDYEPEVLPMVWELLNEVMEALPKGHKIHPKDFPNGLYTTQGHFKFGYIGFNHTRRATEEEKDIVVRFAKEFGRTYQRFLDLQKAEAQAREAQIEVALERIRSQSMAMHKSEELKDVIQVLYDQFIHLGINIEHAGFIIDYKKNDDMHIWLADKNAVFPKIVLPYFDSAHWNSFKDAKKKGQNFFTNQLGFEEKNKFYKDLFEFIPDLPEETKATYFGFDGLAISTMLSDNVGLYIENYAGIPFSDAENKILMRFGKVFQQTYTRFLDLQKAEAQAREAQIEAALERVRAQSNAMHKSEDLANVVTTLYEELRLLNSKILRCGIGIINKKSKNVNTWITSDLSSGTSIELSGDEPLSGHPLLDSIFDYWMKQKNLSYLLEGKDLIEYYKTVIKTNFQKHFAKEGLDNANAKQYYHCTMFPAGGLYVFESSPITKEQIIVLQRFTDAFNRAYTRHQDLQKAEAQAKEAQIEMALEKVRSRTMAMQKGEEVKDVVVLLYKELIALGVTNFATCGYVEINEETKRQETWVTSPGGDSLGLFYLPLTGDVHFDARYKAWKNKQTVFHQTVAGKERKKHLEYAITTFNSKEAEEMVLTQFPDPTVFYCFNFSHGYLHLVSGSYLKDDEEILLARFTRVFEQTYARFLDLQKAEEQTRAAQINLAVERVRAKALAMHKSEEIMDVVAKLKDEVMGLDIPDIVAATIFLNEGKDKVRMWDLSSLEKLDEVYQTPLDITFRLKKADPHLYVKRVWENPNNYFVETQDTKGFKRIIAWLREHDKNEVAQEVETFIEDTQLKLLYHATKKLNSGKLCVDILSPPSYEMETILTKMGAAFDLAYKRFEDLKKAEAQAKEAQVETALEKVRSRSMAMHNSNELLEVITVVSNQLTELGIRFSHASFGYYDNDDTFNFWTSARGKTEDLRLTVPYADLVILNNIKEAQKQKLTFFSDLVSNADHIKWHKHLLKHVDANLFSEEENAYIMSKGVARSIAINPNIMLILANHASIPYSDEENKIIERFGLVFEQSYTRFLDLKRAEAQAREAQIETALEKVRSRSLAMHQSEELWDVINEIFLQLEALKIQIDSCFINIYQGEHPKDITCYIAAGGQTYKGSTFIAYNDFNVFNRLIEAREKKESFYSIIMDKKEKDRWWKHFLAKASNIKVSIKRKNYLMKTTGLAQSVVLGEYASIHMMKYKDIPYLEEENNILMRFGKAFDQVYTRFLDLEKAETQARESQIEASLERVRSRTLAMQTSEELAETSVIVFKQLLELGIAPNRLFIGIVKSDNDTIEAWTTNEDGSKLAVHFTPQASKNKSIKKMLDGWKQQKKSLIIDMKGKELQAYFKYLNEEMKIPFIDGLKQKRRVQTIAYFSGGLIGMAAPEEQPNDTINLLERFAAVFNLTYTRFKDLKIAEANAEKAEQDLIKLQAAKKSAEEALSELQLTQNQLIQSEKMASLGELTAGIAHEIQNPLNFVNNFSEVSKELLDEMIEELENGDMEEVRAITDDVIQNLEKINHHGKRADGIVKGMLQHSRSSTGTKEPTDINTLGDEYLRLAYHGLRAKDKGFNATLVTDFDDTIGKINIIPQDIGRVVLNLLTNAFYVVNEKKQQNIDGYEPTVSLTTKKNGNLVTISVKDNGNGIPKKVVDKIFQPFFTTKPTGEGTGLGLSMSYDIITKGHGGELKVNTVPNKGTEFIIVLPV